MTIDDIIINSIMNCKSVCNVLVEVRDINASLIKMFDNYLLTPARITELTELTIETALKKLQELKKGM